MIFNPTDKAKIFSQTLPHFTIDGHCLQFVNEFCNLNEKFIICMCVLIC